jgi:3-deoxy-D-manno-octulosonic-acid transferase
LGRKYSESFRSKLGIIDHRESIGKLPRPRVWFHAVSVGEVVALGGVIKAFQELAPEASILVSTGTETGQAKARETLGAVDAIFYMPLDFIFTIRPVVDFIRPDLFVVMETELWPNLIHMLKARRAKVVLANGRISDRSFPRYKRLRKVFRHTLECIDIFLMSSALDAGRIEEMGAASERIIVTGNTKMDAALSRPEGAESEEIGRILALQPNSRVLVAGSVHPGETEIVLSAYKKLLPEYPDLTLALAPRHIEKTPLVLRAIREAGLESPDLFSSLSKSRTTRKSPIIVIDVIGKLFQVYSIASAVFVGGSLVPRGGQNILEPAAWGKVVLFGPSMEDFREARDSLLRCRAGVEVRSANDIKEAVARILENEPDAREKGKLGEQAIMAHAGSSGKTAVIISALV